MYAYVSICVLCPVSRVPCPVSHVPCPVSRVPCPVSRVPSVSRVPGIISSAGFCFGRAH